jgi:triosephosphate isomerase
MSRTPLLAGNWKMHGTRTEAVALASALVDAVGQVTTREVMIAPPFTALEAVAPVLSGTRVHLGAQNLHWETTGAFTGEIAAPMLREAGCSHVIIGHSERRQYFSETDATVNQRLRAALAGGLVPVVCVGETLEEREGERTEAVVACQLRGGLAGLDAPALAGCVIAYEPVWAIGTGRTATPEQAQEVHALIRRELGALAGAPFATATRVLYGGSVKPDNVDALMAQPDIDGALVGGASLDAASFTRIVRFEG